jgi:hypothetical protein
MKIFIIIILISLVFNVKAQTENETKTVFGNNKSHIGYFINPSCQFGKIAGSAAVMPGIGAGITLNNVLSLGLNYKYIATENTPTGEVDNSLYLDQRYIGFKGEYSIFPLRAVHLNFPVEAGFGETELDVKDSYENNHLIAPTDDAWFGYLEPGILLEINLWKYLKLNFSTSYRLVSNVTFRNLSEKDFRGLNYSTSIKIGIF